MSWLIAVSLRDHRGGPSSPGGRIYPVEALNNAEKEQKNVYCVLMCAELRRRGLGGILPPKNFADASQTAQNTRSFIGQKYLRGLPIGHFLEGFQIF